MIEEFDKDLFKRCMAHLSSQPVIFDIGAHKGAYTDFVLEQVPDANCYLFEPNMELVRKLIQYKNVSCLAVCERSGYSTIYITPKINDELSSIYKRQIFDETGFYEKIVPCVSIDTFCIENIINNIDYVKIDVEGAELDVINGCHEMMDHKKIKFIQFEYGSTYIDANINFIDILKIANIRGYKCYELINGSFKEVTEQNFVNDYRYIVFLLTYINVCS